MTSSSADDYLACIKENCVTRTEEGSGPAQKQTVSGSCRAVPGRVWGPFIRQAEVVNSKPAHVQEARVTCDIGNPGVTRINASWYFADIFTRAVTTVFPFLSSWMRLASLV